MYYRSLLCVQFVLLCLQLTDLIHFPPWLLLLPLILCAVPTVAIWTGVVLAAFGMFLFIAWVFVVAAFATIRDRLVTR